MQTWEYFVAPLLEHNPGEILNTFGEDGSGCRSQTRASMISLSASEKRSKVLPRHGAGRHLLLVAVKETLSVPKNALQRRARSRR